MRQSTFQLPNNDQPNQDIQLIIISIETWQNKQSSINSKLTLRWNASNRHCHLRNIVGWMITLRSRIILIILISNNYCQSLIIILCLNDIRVSKNKGNYRIRLSIHYFRLEFVVLYLFLLVLVEICNLLLVTDSSALFCRNIWLVN